MWLAGPTWSRIRWRPRRPGRQPAPTSLAFAREESSVLALPFLSTHIIGNYGVNIKCGVNISDAFDGHVVAIATIASYNIGSIPFCASVWCGENKNLSWPSHFAQPTHNRHSALFHSGHQAHHQHGPIPFCASVWCDENKN
jgi:hypothetical protein